MSLWGGGKVDPTLVDAYPLPPAAKEVEITPQDVQRWLGVSLPVEKIAELLSRLEFSVQVKENVVRATPPDHRLDIGTGITGKADLVEEIARVYGYDNIPETRMTDELPPQLGNREL